MSNRVDSVFPGWDWELAPAVEGTDEESALVPKSEYDKLRALASQAPMVVDALTTALNILYGPPDLSPAMVLGLEGILRFARDQGFAETVESLGVRDS